MSIITDALDQASGARSVPDRMPDMANVRRLAHDARYARHDEHAAAAIGFLATAVEGLCDIVEALTTDYVTRIDRLDSDDDGRCNTCQLYMCDC